MHITYFMNRTEGITIMRIIRLDEVLNKTGLSRSTIYKYIAEGFFPKTVSLGYRSVGWVESEVNDWILTRIEQRDEQELSPVGGLVKPLQASCLL